MSDKSVPRFSLTEDRYDQSTFDGRLKQIFTQLDPAKLIPGVADLEDAKLRLRRFKESQPPDGSAARVLPDDGCTDAQLWAARELLEARVHPDTGETIPLPLCFAAYAPMQPPIILGLCWPNASMPVSIFWQWFNQSYNVSVNYANRNAAVR